MSRPPTLQELPADIQERIQKQYAGVAVLVTAGAIAGGDGGAAPGTGHAAKTVGPIVATTIGGGAGGAGNSRIIRIPWSLLVPDNEKYAPALKGRKAVLLLTTKYRRAKAAGKRLVAEQLAGLPPLAGRVRSVGLFTEPDRKQKRDVTNYTKLVHDVCNALAYVDDSQIDDTHWIRTAADIDAPCLRLTFQEIAP